MQTQNSPGQDGAPAGSGRLGRFNQRWRSFISTAVILVAAVLIALFIATFVIQSYQVDGQSMEPTLSDRDRLIVNKVPRTFARIGTDPYIPKRGDIVIFNLEDISGSVNRQLIKRVIALPGEHITVKDGEVKVINDQKPQGFNPDKLGLYKLDSETTPGESDFSLKTNEIYVMGDNRTNSEDSRYFGPIAADVLVGKLSFRILPIDKARHF